MNKTANFKTENKIATTTKQRTLQNSQSVLFNGAMCEHTFWRRRNGRMFYGAKLPAKLSQDRICKVFISSVKLFIYRLIDLSSAHPANISDKFQEFWPENLETVENCNKFNTRYTLIIKLIPSDDIIEWILLSSRCIPMCKSRINLC